MFKDEKLDISLVVKKASFGILIAIFIPIILGFMLDIDFTVPCKYVDTDQGRKCGYSKINVYYTGIISGDVFDTAPYGLEIYSKTIEADLIYADSNSMPEQLVRIEYPLGVAFGADIPDYIYELDIKRIEATTNLVFSTAVIISALTALVILVNFVKY